MRFLLFILAVLAASICVEGPAQAQVSSNAWLMFAASGDLVHPVRMGGNHGDCRGAILIINGLR